MTITAEQALAALEEVVAEKGEDYVYPTALCTYGEQKDWAATYSETQSCAVGLVFKKLAPEYFEVLVQYERTTGKSATVADLHYTVEGDSPLTSEAEMLLSKAQYVQDSGDTYKKMLEVARWAFGSLYRPVTEEVKEQAA